MIVLEKYAIESIAKYEYASAAALISERAAEFTLMSPQEFNETKTFYCDINPYLDYNSMRSALDIGM